MTTSELTLTVAYLTVLFSGPGRSFFQLEALPLEIVLTLGAIAGAWTWAVLHIHGTRVVQRFIDILIAARFRLRAAGETA